MPGTTPVYGFPYPEPTDLVADYPALGQDLAEDIEAVLPTLGGLVPLSPTSIANSGGTASASGATVTFTGTTTVSLNGIFSATYDAYMLIYSVINSTTAENWLRLRAAGTDSATNYNMRVGYFQSAYSSNTQNIYVRLGDNGTERTIFQVLIYNPFAAATTAIYACGNDGATTSSFAAGGEHTAATSYDGITLLQSTGTVTGKIRAYGLRG